MMILDQSFIVLITELFFGRQLSLGDILKNNKLVAKVVYDPDPRDISQLVKLLPVSGAVATFIEKLFQDYYVLWIKFVEQCKRGKLYSKDFAILNLTPTFFNEFNEWLAGEQEPQLLRDLISRELKSNYAIRNSEIFAKLCR